MKAALLLCGFIVLLVCLTIFTDASSIGTPATQYSYALTDDEINSYRNQVELNLYNLQSASGHCEPFNQAICSEIIRPGTSIFVSDTQSQDNLTSQLNDALFLLRVTEAGECRESMVSFLCSQFFPLCTLNEATLAPQSNQPCYPICQRFNETCPQLVDRFALLPKELKPLCAPPTQAQCGYHVDPTKTQSVVIRECPPPLVSVPADSGTGILGGTCEEPCPILMWSRAEYRRMDIMSEILGIFSLITSAFITLTWLVFPKMRQKQFIFWFFVCSFFLSLFLWIGLRLRGTDVAASVNCRTDTEEYQMSGYCLWQGMTTIFFLIAGSAWWMVQSLDVFLKVVLEIRFLDGATSTRVRDVGYHIFSWGIGAVCLIGALASRQIGGYNNGASFCLFSQGRNGTGTDVSYGFFYYPLIVLTALGVIAIGATLIKLIIFKFSTKSAITLSSFIRIFILVLTMLGVCIIIVLYKFLAADRVEIWRASAEEFYTCLLFAEDNPYEDIDCGSSPKLRMPIALKFLYDLIPIAPGILCFLCYGIQAQLYTSWLGLFYDKCGCPCGKKWSSQKKTENSFTDRSTNNNASQNSTQNTQQSVTTQNDTNKPVNKKGMFKGTAATRRPGASGAQTTGDTTLDTPQPSTAGLLARDSHADVSTNESIRPSQVELQDM